MSARRPHAPHAREIDAPEAASTLCQSCGLCCDGSLFDIVLLAPKEQPPKGLPIVYRTDGAPCFLERCGALEGTTCGAYHERPSACRGFECLLSVAVREESVDLESALETVERAKVLIENVTRTLPNDGDTRATMQRARLASEGGSRTEELEDAEAFLETYFLGHRHPRAAPLSEGTNGAATSSSRVSASGHGRWR